MGYSNGTYTRNHNFSADASANIKIVASRHDTEWDDLASALSNVVWTRDGNTVPTANIPMGGRRHINVAAAVSVNNYMRVREFIENVPIFMQDQESSADRISVSAQYFTSVSANQAPGDGTRILVRANSNKSSAVLYLNGHSANVEYQDGGRIASAMVSGGVYEFLFSSADSIWKLQNPDDGRYIPGLVDLQGAAGDGTTVDDTAFTNALASHVEVTGTQNKTFVLSSGITLPTSKRIIRFPGSVIRPDDSNGRFLDAALTATATSTVSSGASIGSRSVVVASASNMAVGQWVRVTESTNEWPAFWAKITFISGTTLEFDRTLPATYSGTVNIDTYSSLRGEFVATDIEWDGSNVTTTPGNDGHVFRLVGRERVIIERLTLKNFDFSTGGFVVQVLDCPDVEILQVRVVDSTIGNQVNFINVDRARSFLLGGMQSHSGGFGVNAFRCESAIFQGNILSGRRKMEEEDSLTAESVRGLKAFGCGYVTMLANDVSDFESPIKVERIHNALVNGNIVRNSGLFTYNGQIALSVTSVSDPVEPRIVITNNIVDNTTGIGIAADSGGGTSVDSNAIVSNNIIKDVGRYAIYCANRKLIAHGNQIENWNTSNTGTGETAAAVYYEGGLTAIGNTFENSDTTDPCFRANFVSGEEYCFRDNALLSGNPYFDGSKVIEMDGATVTITSGNTSVSGNHSLIRTPAQSEIFLEVFTNPASITNDPGPIAVTAISSTQITVGCRNDPGASGMNVRWEARIKMPFTA